MANYYFDRYVWLIELINRYGYIKYEDISRAWAFSPLNSAGSASIQQSELPPRTFYNHIEAIFDTFHIEIKCNRDKGYYIANSEDLDADGVRSWLLQSLSVNNMLNETKEDLERRLSEIQESLDYIEQKKELYRDMQEGRKPYSQRAFCHRRHLWSSICQYNLYDNLFADVPM